MMMMVLLALEAIKYETYMVKKKKAFCTVTWRETVDLCPKQKIRKLVSVCVWTSPDLNFLIRENEIRLFCVFLLRPWATTNYTYGGLLIIVVDTWFSSSFVCIIRLPCGTPSEDLFFEKFEFFFLRHLSIWQRRVSRKLQGKKKWRSLKINIIE